MSNAESRKKSLYKVEFTELKINLGLKPGKFKYVPPTGIVATDITAQVKQNY